MKIAVPDLISNSYFPAREVLEVFATKRRDRRAALTFLKRAMKRYSRPSAIVTDRIRSYRSAMKVIGNAAAHESGRWLNNRAEISHQPFRYAVAVENNTSCSVAVRRARSA